MSLIKIRIRSKEIILVTVVLALACFSGFIYGAEKKPKTVFDVLEREGLFDADTIKELKDSHDPTTGLVGKQMSDVLDTVFQGIAGDPTSPPTRAKKSEEDDEEEVEEGEEAPTALNAIIISGKNKLAVMNGQVVKEGEIVGEKKLVEIHKNKVILEDITGFKEEFLLPRIRIIATEDKEKSEK